MFFHNSVRNNANFASNGVESLFIARILPVPPMLKGGFYLNQEQLLQSFCYVENWFLEEQESSITRRPQNFAVLLMILILTMLNLLLTLTLFLLRGLS